MRTSTAGVLLWIFFASAIGRVMWELIDIRDKFFSSRDLTKTSSSEPSRATMLLKIAAIRIEGSAKGPEAILTQWSAVWKLLQDLSPTSACDDDPLTVLHGFCKAVHVLDVEKPILDFVVGLASSYNCASVTTAVMANVDELRGILLQKVGDLVDSVRAFITLKQTADLIKEGQGVGILQCSAVLRKATGLVDMVAAWEEYASDYKVVHEAFDSKLFEVLAKCDLPLLDQFKAKYGCVSAAVASWEFVGDMAWLTSPTPDPDRDADITALEQFINAYPMTSRIVAELVTMGAKMTWATSTQKKLLVDAKVAFNASDKLVQEVGGILGTMVANALLTNSAVEASKAYVTSKLKISMGSLPSSLRDRLALHSRQGKKSASASADARGDGVPAADEEMSKKAKKMKGITRLT
jgi:hypothetical protein